MTSGTDRNPDAAVRPVSEPIPDTASSADVDWSVGRNHRKHKQDDEQKEHEDHQCFDDCEARTAP